ncbi:hypothetical protein SAMN04487859_12817 [Roseovarius lutimaris]|uniref:Oxidoreductase molybdopterin-binding domain-containing protein n=1 Tax=Roseovarius lutimaris TaxID=1005928 RepID=A0A1I5GCB2_9RHOB|nr:molybdopterin-dependent oxidoreductase [Roseovarius lutimaris]SFO33705.1 hypothetical protein SAMN04487859_12817 [Roseovarius lutimaris]
MIRLAGLKTLALILGLVPGTVMASDILTISGNEASESYSFEDLAALPQEKVLTDNFYVDEVTEFSGPLLRDLLDPFGVTRDDTLKMTAVNDFSVEIPVDDILDYDVILALRRNGETMSIRGKGPIWVIYPMDDHPELVAPQYNDRLIWQLTGIKIE